MADQSELTRSKSPVLTREQAFTVASFLTNTSEDAWKSVAEIPACIELLTNTGHYIKSPQSYDTLRTEIKERLFGDIIEQAKDGVTQTHKRLGFGQNSMIEGQQAATDLLRFLDPTNPDSKTELFISREKKLTDFLISQSLWVQETVMQFALGELNKFNQGEDDDDIDPIYAPLRELFTGRGGTEHTEEAQGILEDIIMASLTEAGITPISMTYIKDSADAVHTNGLIKVLSGDSPTRKRELMIAHFLDQLYRRTQVQSDEEHMEEEAELSF